MSNLYPTPPLPVLHLATQGQQASDDYLVIVDYSMSSVSKRLWVLDAKTHKTIFNAQVAHGTGSDAGGGKLRFSNIPNSKMSSLGFMTVGAPYYSNKFQSTALKLHGRESGINDNVYKRTIVIHLAPYVARGGRSWGCLALTPEDGTGIIKLLTGKKVTIFAYYPDKNYLENSKILNK